MTDGREVAALITVYRPPAGALRFLLRAASTIAVVAAVVQPATPTRPAALDAVSPVLRAPAPAATTTAKTVIQYIVSPHPDDVFEGWSLVQNSASNYPVFIQLTKGEATRYCADSYAVPITVQYYGSFDRGTVAGCKGARMASLNTGSTTSRTPTRTSTTTSGPNGPATATT